MWVPLVLRCSIFIVSTYRKGSVLNMKKSHFFVVQLVEKQKFVFFVEVLCDPCGKKIDFSWWTYVFNN